jgi:hypothetical protein
MTTQTQHPELYKRLETLAYKRSIPFCYGCYAKAPSGRCSQCFSDDLMREMAGVGCEYGTDWIIEAILNEELTPVDLSEEFEESVRQCYSETTKVAWMEFDTVNLAKEMDSISWRCAQGDYESQEESEGNIITFDGSTYYRTSDVEEFLDKVETEEVPA